MSYEEKAKSIAAQVRAQTPPAIVENIATLQVRAANARKRIDEEGEVVRDPKGSVIPHPAIQIERDSIKAAADLLAKWFQPTPQAKKR